MYSDAGNSEKALSLSNKVLSKDEFNLECLIARGSIYIENKNFNEAYADFKHAVDHHPSSGRAWSGLGQIDFYNFQVNDAVESLEHAVEFMPNHVGTWHLLAWAYLMRDDIDKAHDAFEQSYLLDRNFGETHGGLASIYALKGEKEKAQKHIKIADRLDKSGYSSTYAKLVLLNKDGKHEEAKEMFEKAKNTPNEKLGITPRVLIEQRLQELEEQNNPKSLN